MTSRCVLEAGGYRVAFAFDNGDASREYLDTTVELSLTDDLGAFAVKAQPTFLAVKDLQRLATYLEEHIAALQADPDREAPLFVPLELGFQFHALSGEVLSEDEGEFTLRCLVNVGQGPEDGGRVYVGAEAVVDVARVKEFIASLEGVAAALLQGR